jgi:hypothetical protein
VVGPLSSSFVPASTEEEKVAVNIEGKQCCSSNLKNRIKSQKSGFKVVRDMLAKKWIFVKAHKQLEDFTLKSFSAGKLQDIKILSEMTLFMEAIRNLAEASKKAMKRGVNHKHNTTKS